MKSITVVKVWSDNFDGTLFTFEAYRELRLSMSTGDFHTHKYEILEVPSDASAVTLEAWNWSCVSVD